MVSLEPTFQQSHFQCLNKVKSWSIFEQFSIYFLWSFYSLNNGLSKVYSLLTFPHMVVLLLYCNYLCASPKAWNWSVIPHLHFAHVGYMTKKGMGRLESGWEDAVEERLLLVKKIFFIFLFFFCAFLFLFWFHWLRLNGLKITSQSN